MQDLYKAIIGDKNQAYYLQKFEYSDQEGPGLKSSWNWPAFLFSITWALYRKMYGWFFILWVIIILSNFIEKAGSPGLGGLIFVGTSVFFGVYANSLYHNNAKKKIAHTQCSIKDEPKLLASLNRKGGVHTWVIYVAVLLPIIGIVAAIAIPAYHDYTTRNKSAEASEKYDWSKVKVEPESCPNGYYVEQNKCVKIEFTPIPDAAEPLAPIVLKPYEGDYDTIKPTSCPNGYYVEQNKCVKIDWSQFTPEEGQAPIATPTEPVSVQGITDVTSTTSSRNSNKTSNFFGPKEQKCQDQYYATVNSANHDMPIGEFAEFNKRARQRERECINR